MPEFGHPNQSPKWPTYVTGCVSMYLFIYGMLILVFSVNLVSFLKIRKGKLIKIYWSTSGEKHLFELVVLTVSLNTIIRLVGQVYHFSLPICYPCSLENTVIPFFLVFIFSFSWKHIFLFWTVFIFASSQTNRFFSSTRSSMKCFKWWDGGRGGEILRIFNFLNI